MKMIRYRPLLRAALAFFVAAALFLAGFGETALAGGHTEAAALLERGQGAAAYERYMALLRENPADDAAYLGLARAAARTGRWNQAVLALETLLEKYPREAGLYDQLAHAYLALNDRAGAEQIQAAKRALGPGAAEFPMDDLEKRYRLLQVHGKIRMGVLYDSNANQGTDQADLRLGGWRVEAPDAQGRATFGAYLGANLDLARKFERDSDWWAVGDAQAYIRGNANNDLGRAHSRESQWGRGAVGLRRLTAETLAELRFKAEIFDYEWFQNVAAYGPELTFLYAATPDLQLIARGGLERRVYSSDPARDGAYYTLGQYARFLFAGRNHEFTLGARYRGGAPDKTDYAYDGWEISAHPLFKLQHGLEISPFIAYGRDDYRGPATALETEKRRDERLRGGLGLTWRLDEAWSVECGWQYTRNRSTSALYTYDQHALSAGLAWEF